MENDLSFAVEEGGQTMQSGSCPICSFLLAEIDKEANNQILQTADVQKRPIDCVGPLRSVFEFTKCLM
jgi:hypothetical protein